MHEIDHIEGQLCQLNHQRNMVQLGLMQAGARGRFQGSPGGGGPEAARVRPRFRRHNRDRKHPRAQDGRVPPHAGQLDGASPGAEAGARRRQGKGRTAGGCNSHVSGSGERYRPAGEGPRGAFLGYVLADGGAHEVPVHVHVPQLLQ
ncbi:unnamed protein product [Ectocarpus sp. 12 AP-2014]